MRLDAVLGSLDVRDITPRDLETFYVVLRRTQWLAGGTVRNVHAVRRGCLGQAVKWWVLESNPALRASPPKHRGIEVQPPDLEQVQALIRAAREVKPAFARLLRLMAATGVRR